MPKAPLHSTGLQDGVDLVRPNSSRRFFNKWVDIVLSVVSIVQGFAFSNLAQRLPDVWQRVVSEQDYSLGVYYLLCFVILIRVFETYVLAALDYEEWDVSFSDVFYIFVIGFLEYFLFDSISSRPLDVVAFHSRLIVLSMLGLAAYVSTLGKLRPSRFVFASLYDSEVALQRANVFGSLVLTVSSAAILVWKDPNYFMPAALVGVIVTALNVWYSLRKTISLRIQIVSLELIRRTEERSAPRSSYTVRPAGRTDVDAISGMLATDFYYVYEALFEASPTLTKDLLQRLLTANGGYHNLGFRSFFVSVSPDTNRPIGMMLLSPPVKFGWSEIKATCRFMMTLLRHLGLPKVVRVLRNMSALSTIIPVSGPNDMNVSYIAVLPDDRRQGVATSLLAYAVGTCRSTGAHALLAEIRETNTAGRRLFSESGFEEVALLKSASDSLLNRGPRILVRQATSSRQEVVMTD